jgi:hypothetical protein
MFVYLSKSACLGTAHPACRLKGGKKSNQSSEYYKHAVAVPGYLKGMIEAC